MDTELIDVEETATLPALPVESAALSKARREIERLRRTLVRERDTRRRLCRELALRGAALDTATTHFMIIDMREPRGGRIVYVNRAFAAQHGYDGPEMVVGRSFAALMRRHARREDREQLHRALAEGRQVSTEIELARRDGSRFLVGFTATPLRNVAGVLTHYVSLGADITARRESERKREELQQQLYEQMRERERMAIELRLAQKLEAVGRLAAGLAHEINTPIQYVCDSVHFLRSAFVDLNALFEAYQKAMTELAQASGAWPALGRLSKLETEADRDFLLQEIPKAFERTLEGADRVASIVRAMKEFAYPDGAEHVAADLNRALETTLTVARNEYKYTAEVVTSLGELPLVVCNVGELNQVFLNLIVNAAHAIRDAGRGVEAGRIEIATRAAGGSVEIAVTDNGCGITEENLERIFDPFFTTKEVGRGTGQGLSIARTIVVDKHGGSIDVHSTLGRGTCFKVCLPVGGRASKEQA